MENNSIEEIYKRIPIKTTLRIFFEMHDYNNWDNGEYKGNREEIEKKVELLYNNIIKWIENGMHE